MSLKFDYGSLKRGLQSFEILSDNAIRIYAETTAKNFEGYARENRSWQDRTGDARKGLTGYVKKTLFGYRVVLAHTVDYGIWLELAHEKKNAIIEPTIRLKSPEVMRGFNKLLNGIRV